MKKWEKDSWESFNKNSAGKKVIIYGAGARCTYYLPIMNRIYDIPYIVDSNNCKWGSQIAGKKIVSPDVLIDLDKNTFVVLILVQKAAPVANILEKMGIYNYYSEYWMNNMQRYSARRKQLDFPVDKIRMVLDLLSDEKSKIVFKEILKKRKEDNLDYSDIMDEGEYFREEFFKPSVHDVYVDGGVFDGDTVEQYIRYNPDFEKIYAFEADKVNYEKFVESFIYQGYKSKIEAFSCGLYDKQATLDFYAGMGVSSGLVENFSAEDFSDVERVKCVSIDEVINDRVTFIKMDIEGGETKAIEDAQQTLQKYKPNLAICIYHKPDDLWNIPLLIHEIVPEYHFYIRHHSQLYVDTVLYAHI